MAAHPEPSLDDHLWTIAAARLLLPEDVAVQAPPNLAYDDFRACSTPASTTGAASARDDRPRQPRGALARPRRLAAATRSRGLELAPRLPVYPVLSGDWVDPGCSRQRFAPPTRSGSPARTAGTRASRAASRSWSARCAAGRHGRRAGGGGARPALPRPRRGAAARVRGRRPAAARGLRRRGQLRRDAEHPVHERLLLPLRLLRVLEGPAGGEPPRRALPRPARRDRPARARGMGSRRDRGLPPGRDPPGVHRRLLRVRRRGDPGRAARPAHPRLLGARGLAGRGDARPAARGVPGPAARARPGLAARDGRRDPRRRGARGDLPRQGLDRAVARRARGRAPRRPALERDDHVRARRAARALGAAPAAGEGAAGAIGTASRSSCRCRSCTWRRRCG